MSLTEHQLLRIRALRFVANRVETTTDLEGYCEVNGEPKEFADAVRQVLTTLRQQASRLEGKK